MLVTKISKYGFMTFKCPICGSEDSSYVKMPKKCYYCTVSYEFDVEKLTQYLEDRISYHLYEKTSDFIPFSP